MSVRKDGNGLFSYISWHIVPEKSTIFLVKIVKQKKIDLFFLNAITILEK